MNPKFRSVETKTARFYSIKSDWLIQIPTKTHYDLMTLQLDNITPVYVLKDRNFGHHPRMG